MRVAGASGDPFAKRNSVQRAPFKSKASFKERKQPRDSPDSLDDEGLGDVVPAASNASRKDKRTSVDKGKSTPARSVLKDIRSSRLPKKLQVPNLDFDRFLRIKEREHQGAAVHDVRTARSGVLRSVRLGAQPETEECSFEDFAFFENSLPAEETLPSLTSPSPRPGSRPGTGAESRQSARNREARLKLLDAQLEKELEENHDETFVAVAQREQLKQEYWQKYNEAGSAKKTLSEFEEWQRLLHGGKAEVSTTAPSEVEDLATSRVSGLEQSDWRISHLGFTRRSEHEEYVSDYYRRCRERHYIPLGPRGSTPRQAKGHAHAVVDPVAVEPGVLDFGGWSLGSDRLDMLCQ
ncbi:Cemip, partial [Symbiodinium sp. CCMP2456]